MLVGLLCLPLTSHADGFNFRKPSPLTVKGDIFVRTNTSDVALPVGANGTVLSADSSEVTGLKWVAVSGGGSGTVTNSGTLTSNAVIIGAGTTVVTAITADTATTGHFLASTATSPAFRQVVTGDVTGIQPVSTGGTGITSGTSGGLPFFSTTGLMASSAALTANAVIVGGGVGATPVTITADTVTTHALFATATTPAFRQPLTSDITGVFPMASGGTGHATSTKGDILVSTGSAWNKLTVGANGTNLSADSSTTTGVAWVAQPTSAGGSPGGTAAQMQVNNAGAFGGVPLVTADTARARLAIGLLTINTVSLDVAGSMRSIPFNLTDGTTIAVDVSKSNNFRVILGGNRTLSNPTNCNFGQNFIVLVSQDATGGRKMGFGTAYRFGADVPSYDSSTVAGTRDYIGFKCVELSVDVVSVSRSYR